MITCTIMGGLGNQLFQIFATIAYAIQHNHGFIFPYSHELRANTTRYTYWETFLASLKPFTTANPDTSITNADLDRMHMIHMLQHEHIEIPPCDRNHAFRVHGYFQSYKYFEKEKDIIYNMIGLANWVKLIRNENARLFRNDNYKISMHFRLGDYKHIQYCHNILPFYYYKNALSVITQPLSNDKKITVFVFREKEDNETVENMVNQLREIWPSLEFVTMDDSIEDWKQMLLMSCCDSNIIANSSFSWWGAYINNNPDKVVCYPSRWFGPTLQHNYIGDMFPSKWQKIDVM